MNLSPKDQKILYWGLSFTGFWTTCGLFIDGWAHTHDKVDISFFTPYHGVLYSGLGASMAFMVFYMWKAVRVGVSWIHALSPSYRLAFMGGIVFMFGGVFDLLWHALFGIELDVEALYSPSHIMLAVGGMLLGSGVFREAMRRSDASKLNFFRDFGVIISFTGFMATILFFTQIAHPVTNLWGGAEVRYNLENQNAEWLFRQMGVTGVFLTTMILISGMHVLLSRWQLPFGVFTVYIGVSSIGMGFLYGANDYPLLPVIASIVGGITIDVLYRVLQPSRVRVRELRQFLLVAPMIPTTYYFISLLLSSGIWWSVHLWTGAIAISGLTGLLMSYVFIPPELSYESSSDRRNQSRNV